MASYDRRDNDVHMKIRPDDTDEKEEARVERQLSLVALQRELRAITEMGQTPGWALFQEDLKRERLDLLNRQLHSTDPTTLAKLVGSQLVVERFVNWISIVQQELEASARDLSKPE